MNNRELLAFLHSGTRCAHLYRVEDVMQVANTGMALLHHSSDNRQGGINS
ncbi:hypothetical protein [Wolbachia endosymbiont of Trichogramma pretiosum]|nr:hypothetical protein [Wolbachia endosymbiont of Trichogramma pretiosum]OCA06894.1 hypothetical protein wTpre_1246 [Wolbachia endosymbiont of Trichogramma pretiosum]